MNRFILLVLATLALAASLGEADMNRLRAKLGRKFGIKSGHQPMVTHQYYAGGLGGHVPGGLHASHGPRGSSGSASASAAAASNGAVGGSAASAAASASGGYQRGHHAHRPVYRHHQPAVYAPAASEPMPVYHNHQQEAAAAAAAAAAATTASAAPAKPVYRFYQPTGRHHQPQFFGAAHQLNHPPRFAHLGGHHNGAAAASAAASSGSAASTAAGAGVAGGAAAGATAAAAASSAGHHQQAALAPHDSHEVEEENFEEHYDEPETSNIYEAATGTHLNTGDGHETDTYIKETEDITNHEDGKESDNHYYNAQSYGKTLDEKKRERYNNYDEDIVHTPTVYRSKKSSTNYAADLNKARRENGSGVLAKDKHSASYNKNSRKFNEKVDRRNQKHGAGVMDTKTFSSNNNFEEDDDEVYDSDGVGFVGVDGVAHGTSDGNHGARSGSASSSVTDGGIATSAAVGQNAASSTSAASGHH